jgi:hypothetical protein
MLVALPLLSVSGLAWATANPFNGLVFAATGLTLVSIAARFPRGPVVVGPTWAVITGAGMFVFGWVYPHFVEAPSPVTYAYAAPTGLIPCPTLSVAIGLTLVLRGMESVSWSLTLAAVGLFYGVFGAARLGVALDWVLLFGAALLVTLALVFQRPQHGEV